MRTIVFYGDSNTYGFDPRGFAGGRYPASSLWTSLVSEAFTGWTIVNAGLNGRTLPIGLRAYEMVDKLLEGLGTQDVFAVMLGTNDLLCTWPPDEEGALARMERFLSWLREKAACPRLLIIAPPHLGAPDGPDPSLSCFYDVSRRMNEGFRLLAERSGAYYADASEWNIDMAFDGIHFTEEGHRRFAKELAVVLQSCCQMRSGMQLCRLHEQVPENR